MAAADVFLRLIFMLWLNKDYFLIILFNKKSDRKSAIYLNFFFMSSKRSDKDKQLKIIFHHNQNRSNFVNIAALLHVFYHF